jgi:ABC-type multidrug transport system ATPase subunit
MRDAHRKTKEYRKQMTSAYGATPLAIEMAGLTKQFGRHRAVDTLNLAVSAGTVFGFLGPNGAGKTTTIRMLLGLIRPTQGSGRILGYDIERERAAILPHVGAIVESPAFYPILSAYDNLRVLDRTAGNEDRHTIKKVLEQVGLSERSQDKVRTYSLGMKQRLAIAASLLNAPQIIFLDEPTNGLDPAGTTDPAPIFEWSPCKRAFLNHAAASTALPRVIHPDAPDGNSPAH